MVCPKCGHVHHIDTTGGYKPTQHTEKREINQTTEQNRVGRATNGTPLSDVDEVLHEPLSLRELEVLYLVIQGEANRQIAEHPMISDRRKPSEQHLWQAPCPELYARDSSCTAKRPSRELQIR
jgi:FixJ family two-component response regulator